VLFLLGEGPAEHRLRQLAAQLGLMHQVTFVDRLGQTQLPGIFSAADLFIYPRSDRQFELELLEAMAAGVPVLVGDCCVGDFTHEGLTSISYRPNDAADLLSKLRTLLDEPASAAALAEGARRYLREHHSPARMVAATAELYRKFALSERTLKLA
jgi:phosphatidylinositol alpha-1,6-mannosyltransferase